jgi:1,4-alpha-glucan branching enzyme
MVQVNDDMVVFQLLCPDAAWVSVCGDFNHWSPAALPMHEVKPGVWEARVKLPPGEYRFRYQTSNRGWLTDWSAGGVQRNPYGDWDSLLTIPTTAAKAAWRSDEVAEERLLRRQARSIHALQGIEPRPRVSARPAETSGAR